MLAQMAVVGEQLPVKEPIDGRVIAACQQGDRHSLRLIFEAYKDRVYSIALYSLSGDESFAADVTQQVFLKLMTRIGQFRGDSEFTTWLYRLVVNTCLDERRKQRRLVPLTDFEVIGKPSQSGSQVTQYAQHETAALVQRAIAELKPKLRLPILLKYIEGLSYEEIASVLGCSKGTVASRLNRAHKALAGRLESLRGKILFE